MSWSRALLGLLVAAGYALALTSIFVAPIAPWVLLVHALFIAIVVNLGVGFLNLGVFVDVVSRGPAGRPAVALTFDDGPHPVHTRSVLRALAAARPAFKYNLGPDMLALLAPLRVEGSSTN